MNPCCPKILTLTVSCFFHQSFGSPVPLKLDGAPFVKLPLAPSLPGTAVNRAVFQGSSAEEFGAGECGTGGGGWRYAGIGAVKSEVEGWRELRSRLGSGRAFCEARAAT